MQLVLFKEKKADGVNIQGKWDLFSVKKVELLSGRKLTPSDYSDFSRVVKGWPNNCERRIPLNQVVSVGG